MELINRLDVRSEIVENAFSMTRNFNGILEGSDYDICLSTIGAYAYGMLQAAARINETLDLTYGTADLLPAVLKEMWFAGNGEDEEQVYENKRTFVKCLAGYLTLLAVNEHKLNTALGTAELVIPEGEESGEIDAEAEEDLRGPAFFWAHRYSLLVGDLSELPEEDDEEALAEYFDSRTADILVACYMGIFEASAHNENGCVIDSKPIIEAYERATGVNLRDYGFRSLQFGTIRLVS